MNMIIEAAQFASKCHAGQVRKYTNRPYIEHPMRVAGRVLLSDRVTQNLVCAAWLHDTLEDCGLSCGELAYHFPDEIALLVQELTNPSKQFAGIPRYERKKLDREHLGGCSEAAKFIKLLDRIDNLRELPKKEAGDFAKLYAEESLLLLPFLAGVDLALETELRVCAEHLLEE